MSVVLVVLDWSSPSPVVSSLSPVMSPEVPSVVAVVVGPLQSLLEALHQWLHRLLLAACAHEDEQHHAFSVQLSRCGLCPVRLH